jgi:hypothetical protein
VDDLEEQAQLGPSLGKESHRLDAMAHTWMMMIAFGGRRGHLGQ